MKIELINIDELNPFERNPKKHPEEQIKRIIRSIQEFGWTNPVLALKENKIVIAGHARLKAARQMNLREVPVIFLDMPYEKAISYVVTDNRLAEIAEWDNQILLPLLDDIKLSGIDVELTGFTDADISLMSKKEVKEDDFDAGKAAADIKEPVTKPGDVWLLGRHRLMCGDSTKREDVEKMMDGKKADMLFTDPPYGVDYVGKTKDKLKIKNDKDSNKFDDFLISAFAVMYEHLKETGSFYVCCPAGNNHLKFILALEKNNLQIRQGLVWNKQQMVLGHSDYHYSHEPILYGWKGKGHYFINDRTQTSVWSIPKPTSSHEHPTMKPIELSAKAILNSSVIGWLILDLYGGSGSTLIACEQLDRICYMMELDPIYCDVIIQRWEKFTGQKAKKVRDATP